MYKLLLLLLLSGCTITSVRDKNGVTRFRSGADMTFFHYKDENTELTITSVDHSTPTKAAAAGIANGIAAGAAAGILGVR